MRVLERLMYIGPNRRSSRTVIEWLIELEPGEPEHLVRGLPAALSTLPQRLRALVPPGPPVVDAQWPDPADGGDPFDAVGLMLAGLAIALQRAAGHEVHFTSVIPVGREDRRRVVFEYEHNETGEEAGEIAAWIVTGALPGLCWRTDLERPEEGLEYTVQGYLERAREAVLPRDAQAVIDAAARRDIPVAKLEREPYQGLKGSFRIRPHGLLRLGHARHMRILDGTLCLERSAHLIPLLFDGAKRRACMRELGFPLPASPEGSSPLAASRRVVQAAGRLGYPVVLKPVTRLARWPRGFDRARTALRDEAALLAELDRLRPFSPQVLVEKFIEGDTWHVLVAGGEVLGAVRGRDGDTTARGGLDPGLMDLARQAAGRLDSGLLAVTLVSPDPSRPVVESGGAIVSLDPAPQLDRLLPDGSGWMVEAAEALVRWLYPGDAPSRIPLVAVTGTNGKTTTSRLIERIAKQGGLVPGLASTVGVYIDGTLREAGDQAGITGHQRLFESREVEFAVLETARGGVANSGFMFDRCDVGVCVNVSEDHIGEFGIDSLEALAGLKRSILERATAGVVLNADYPACQAMLPFAESVEVCLCSLTRDAPALLENANRACVVEPEDREGGYGPEWLVSYEAGERVPVLPVADFPAALGGAARFNLSNAQHAIGAARMMGFDVRVIAQALRAFDTDFDTNPGRLNVYRGHPFTVIMDYAHNPDGMAQLLDCIDRLGVTGRRILLYAATGNRSDAEARRHTLFPVGRIDHFVVRRYPGKLRGRGHDEIPRLMHAALREAGVPEACITLADPPETAANVAMSLAEPGDLVILAPGSGEFATMWQQIVAFGPDGPVTA